MAFTASPRLSCHYLDICLSSRSWQISLIPLQQSGFKVPRLAEVCLYFQLNARREVWCSGAGLTGAVLVFLSWLLLMGPRLMSWSATPQCSCSPAPPPHHHLSPNRFCADVQQLITTIGFTLLQSYKSPPVRLGPSGTATAGSGQARRGREGGRREEVITSAHNHK